MLPPYSKIYFYFAVTLSQKDFYNVVFMLQFLFCDFIQIHLHIHISMFKQVVSRAYSRHWGHGCIFGGHIF